MIFKKNKRVISFALALLMAFTALPINTFASEIFINSGFNTGHTEINQEDIDAFNQANGR